MALQISHNQIYLFQIQIYLLLNSNYGSALSTILSNSKKDIKKFVVDEGQGVKGLSDIGLQTLPKQYIQPPQEQISTSTILTEESIPDIDMSNSNEQMVADMICNAAEKWGFLKE
ncbi:unnamed protein product [Fraxinus pennsylvanica]|uniref:Uncharacterized protein n=1 Tax=Fraxinus pennsylvanica TaxID=56036 RepID=A0AAD1ZKF3_9LAMI|nr:unnamed protein product [Fraxinus pennsylvanica]